MEFVNNFVQQIANMRWSDYLDILIVAGLIYMLLPMIRSTGAMRIAKVVFGIMIIAWLAMVLQLSRAVVRLSGLCRNWLIRVL